MGRVIIIACASSGLGKDFSVHFPQSIKRRMCQFCLHSCTNLRIQHEGREGKNKTQAHKKRLYHSLVIATSGLQYHKFYTIISQHDTSCTTQQPILTMNYMCHESMVSTLLKGIGRERNNDCAAPITNQHVTGIISLLASCVLDTTKNMG